MREKIIAKFLDLIFPSLCVFLGAVLLTAEKSLSQLIPSPQEIWAVRAVALAVVLFGLLVGVYFWLKPKFRHLSDIGVHQEIKTGVYVCSHCWITKKLCAPLNDLGSGQGWRCPACSKSVHTKAYLDSLLKPLSKINYPVKHLVS